MRVHTPFLSLVDNKGSESVWYFLPRLKGVPTTEPSTVPTPTKRGVGAVHVNRNSSNTNPIDRIFCERSTLWKPTKYGTCERLRKDPFRSELHILSTESNIDSNNTTNQCFQSSDLLSSLSLDFSS